VRITPERVTELRKQGASRREIAKVLEIGRGTAIRVYRSTDGDSSNKEDMSAKSTSRGQYLGSLVECRMTRILIRYPKHYTFCDDALKVRRQVFGNQAAPRTPAESELRRLMKRYTAG
jgi:hypothetical protein